LKIATQLAEIFEDRFPVLQEALIFGRGRAFGRSRRRGGSTAGDVGGG